MILNRDFSQPNKKPIAWTIAGSDNSGGAGVQADQQSFRSFGVYGCTVITAITAQNSQAVTDILPIPAEQISSQLESLQQEYPADAIKLGMLATEQIATQISKYLSKLAVPIVCDPVLFATNGGSLMESNKAYQQLLPWIDILTPNETEFYQLFGGENLAPDALADKALQIANKYKIDLVITDGESRFNPKQTSDLCVIAGEVFWLHSAKQNTNHTHGTGCSFSSALAAGLALGYSRFEAVVLAKTYINQGLIQPTFFQHTAGFIHTTFPNLLDCLPKVSSQYQATNIEFTSMPSRDLGIYPVVDNLELLKICAENGCKIIQLRIKDLPEKELDSIIQQAVEISEHNQIWLFINDHWKLAIKHQAFGVHLGQEDLPTADLVAIEQAGIRIGISTHSWFEIAKANSLKPSYIAIGPIFATTTKQMPFAPQGLQQLQQWQRFLSSKYPLVAIGGIDKTNAKAVLATGVDAIAMVRPLQTNTKRNLKQLMNLVTS